MTRPASFQTDTTAGGRGRGRAADYSCPTGLSLPIDEVRTTRIVAKGDRQRGKLGGLEGGLDGGRERSLNLAALGGGMNLESRVVVVCIPRQSSRTMKRDATFNRRL